MKKMLIGAMVVGLTTCAYGVQIMPLSFDKLYPSTLFGQAREHCVRAWGSLDELLGSRQRNMRSALLLDAVLGQITYAKSCVKKIESQRIPLSNEDLVEFSRVVGTVVDRSERLSDNDPSDKITLLKKLLSGLREHCEKIMNHVRDF